jgi:hypothetical protein
MPDLCPPMRASAADRARATLALRLIRRVVLGLLPAPEPGALRLAPQACGLPDFNQVPIRVADVGTDFAAVILRLGEELRAPR